MKYVCYSKWAHMFCILCKMLFSTYGRRKKRIRILPIMRFSYHLIYIAKVWVILKTMQGYFNANFCIKYPHIIKPAEYPIQITTMVHTSNHIGQVEAFGL